MDLLLISNENKLHYVYIKDFNRFMCNIKNIFANDVYNVLVVKKEICLIINGKQSVKLKSRSISLQNYFKQLPVPFKIYADFKCLFNAISLKGVKSNNKNNGSWQ